MALDWIVMFLTRRWQTNTCALAFGALVMATALLERHLAGISLLRALLSEENGVKGIV